MGGVKDKVALVTGAASGLGRAQAKMLAEHGARVAAADIDAAGGEQTVAEIAAACGEAAFWPLDVTDEAGWQATVAAVVDRFGRLDVLVNNAGVELVKSIPETSFAEWRRLMAVNLDGVFLGTRAAIGVMGAGGSIVNISSVAGLIGFTGQAAYCASKGGVRLLTKAAAVECAEAGLGIRVNSVHPGVIDTPMYRAFTAGLDEAEAAAAMGRIAALHPLGRVGEPLDVAGSVLFLAGDDSKFMTGAELVVDGGLTAR